MDALTLVITILQLLCGLAVIVIVLFQSGKSAGLSGAIGGVADSFLSRNKAKTLDATRQQYMRELENKDKQYRDILTDKNRWLRRMFFCLIGMLAVISFLLIVDFINPTIGVLHT